MQWIDDVLKIVESLLEILTGIRNGLIKLQNGTTTIINNDLPSNEAEAEPKQQ